MKDVFSIIQELTGQYTYLPQGPFKEEHIKELQPVEYVSSYYQNPMQAFHDPRNDQKYIIEWKNEKGRVKELNKQLEDNRNMAYSEFDDEPIDAHDG